MRICAGGLRAAALLGLSVTVYAQGDSPAVRAISGDVLTSIAYESLAQAAMRKLASNNGKREPASRLQRIPEAEKTHPDLLTRLEEMRVYGRNEPEDFVGPKKSPMMQFRARLERDVPLSPAKKVQRVLCFVGLCSNYGPEGIPLGDSPEVRADARLYQSTTQLNAQFRGTLQ